MTPRTGAAQPAEPYVSDPDFTLWHGDVREVLAALPERSVNCCVTSPPYWGLRDYGVDGQIGLEQTPDEYVAKLVEVFREVRRVLADDGTLWLNLGDSYNNRAKTRETSHQPALNDFVDDAWADRAARGGVRMSISDGDLKEKDLVGIPWMLAFALRADGWYLRSDIIWSKPNPMPESVTDRPTKAHEYVFLLSKGPRYFFDQEALREDFADERMGNHGRYRSTYANDPRAGGKLSGLKNGEWNVEASQLAKRPQIETLDGSDGEAPRGPDGRRKTVHDHGTPNSHTNYDNVGNGNERWPNGGRNVRSVWEIATQPYPEAHFACFPEELPRRCILAGCHEGGTVLDPFMGSGTTALVARRLGRKSVGVELNGDYCAMAARRLQQLSLLA